MRTLQFLKKKLHFSFFIELAHRFSGPNSTRKLQVCFASPHTFKFNKGFLQVPVRSLQLTRNYILLNSILTYAPCNCKKSTLDVSLDCTNRRCKTTVSYELIVSIFNLGESFTESVLGAVVITTISILTILLPMRPI